MAGTAITDWAQSSGNTVSYNAKNNSINVSGSSYNVGDIAAGKVSGLSYKAGHVYVDNPSAITKNIISNSQGSIGLGENRQEQLTNYDREQTLAADMRANRPKYDQLFAKFGLTFTDDYATRLFNNSADSGGIWSKVTELQGLGEFYDSHLSYYGADTPFTYAGAKAYKQAYGSASNMITTLRATDKLKAHGVDIKDLFSTFGGTSVSDSQILDMFAGKEGSESMQKEWERLMKVKEGATKEEQTRTPYSFDKWGLNLTGPGRSFS